MELTPKQQVLLRAAMRELGRRGGKAAASHLTAEQREERARKAARAAVERMTPEQRRERAVKAGKARGAQRRKEAAHA